MRSLFEQNKHVSTLVVFDVIVFVIVVPIVVVLIVIVIVLVVNVVVLILVVLMNVVFIIDVVVHFQMSEGSHSQVSKFDSKFKSGGD